jgi:ATP-dependent RNA helicase DDX35
LFDCLKKFKKRSLRPSDEPVVVLDRGGQASATQRSGRAGRVRHGKCYRLYTEAAFAAMRPQEIPELQRSDLSTMILQLKALGIDNVVQFDFVSPPPSKLMLRALDVLFRI